MPDEPVKQKARRCGIMRGMRSRRPPIERLAARSQREERGYLTPCRVFLGYRDSFGYGRVQPPATRADGSKGSVLAHVIAYEYVYGRVPTGLEVDHKCDQPDCWEPLHLEAVTHSENVLRSRSPEATRARCAAITHCPNDHEYTAENTYRQGRYGVRVCRACRRAQDRARRPKRA